MKREKWKRDSITLGEGIPSLQPLFLSPDIKRDNTASSYRYQRLEGGLEAVHSRSQSRKNMVKAPLPPTPALQFAGRKEYPIDPGLDDWGLSPQEQVCLIGLDWNAAHIPLQHCQLQAGSEEARSARRLFPAVGDVRGAV